MSKKKKKRIKEGDSHRREERDESDDSPGRPEKGTKHHLPERKDVIDASDKRDRCELCMFWHMRDPRQKQTSCFDRGYGSHDVCGSFTSKPPKVPHSLIREIQMYSMPDVFFVEDVLGERARCIKDATKKMIRTMLRKQGGAVVYYRFPGEKKRHGRVERVTSSSVMLKKAEDEKVRVDYVVEVVSIDEYKARKSNKINKRKEAGRKV